MKYLSRKQILESLERLGPLNQFFGITFLAAKKARLPIGRTTSISLDALTHAFLDDYFKLHPRSEYYFRVFRFNNARKFWVRPDYSGKGLQKLNTSTFRDAFVHGKGSNEWGWVSNYVDVLAKGRRPLPLFHLSVWFCRKKGFDDHAKREDVSQSFKQTFDLSPKEIGLLFDEAIASNVKEEDAFQNTPVKWEDIVKEFGVPADIPPEKGGILSFLGMSGVGPVSPLTFEPAQRMNIITGDNGLGKTFLLDIAWWTLTGHWAGYPAFPNRWGKNRLHLIPKKKILKSPPSAEISFQISGRDPTFKAKVQKVKYSMEDQRWPIPGYHGTISGLVVYARVDGSFAVWDPAGNPGSEALTFDREEVWDGKPGLIEGLLRDWIRWQDRGPENSPFEVFMRVLKRTLPPEMGDLQPGRPVRLPKDPRDIPTIVHSYGEVPILHESAGVKRIIALAYLIVWAWNEHEIRAEQFGAKKDNRMVVIIDEVEAHLHPRWQRVILPALLGISSDLDERLESQLLIATHSPLVLASAEPIFDTSRDKLFHLEMTLNRKTRFEEIPFVKYGRIDSWLTSSVFDLKQPRSRDAESAMMKAIELQGTPSPSSKAVEEVTKLLTEHLPPEDLFWPRWIFFARNLGVKI